MLKNKDGLWNSITWIWILVLILPSCVDLIIWFSLSISPFTNLWNEDNDSYLTVCFWGFNEFKACRLIRTIHGTWQALNKCSVQFSSVQSLSHVRLFATPWTAARQAFLSITNSWSSLRLMSIESVMPFSHFILCRPLLLLPPIPHSIRVFSNESTLRMRWPKYWSFSFSISPFNEHPGLISFRMDCSSVQLCSSIQLCMFFSYIFLLMIISLKQMTFFSWCTVCIAYM